MIRINLLGQARPKAARHAVPLEATLQVILLLVGRWAWRLAVLGHHLLPAEAAARSDQCQDRRAAAPKRPACNRSSRTWISSKARKAVLQQRIDVIETLQKNRTGGQDLLRCVANTVVRVDTLWLTSLERKGEFARHQRRSGIDQRRRQLHYAAEALGLLRQGGNQETPKRTTCVPASGDLQLSR